MFLAATAAQGQIKIGGNVFGGARQADVDGTSTVTIHDGIINNVYGGNDISGTVKGGTNVDIRHSILGDVYGGGNGSYYYTTSPTKAATSKYFQLYEKDTYASNIEALSAFIPHQDDINIHISGTSANPTYIQGRVFCGGNSATVKNSATLRLGSYVIAGSVFLGCNGENMIRGAVGGLPAAMEHYTGEIGLTADGNMETYMGAVAMTAKPAVAFDDGYVDYSTKIGSFYCGGNVGSMIINGLLTLNFNKRFIIYDKLVGGSNTSKIAAKDGVNAAYTGGIIGDPATDGNKLTMNLQGVRLEPRKLTYNESDNSFTFTWNVDNKATEGTGDDRLVGANIYGGCYESGVVNGNVTINILETTVEKSKVFSDDQVEGNSGIPLDQQGDDPLGASMNIFGGGYGENSEITGNTVLNVNSGYTFRVFGGGEKGNITGNCTVNLNGGEVEYLYGGGFEGPVGGNTLVNLGGGKVYDAYGGSCNADITGYAEVFIGRNGNEEDASPNIRHGVFGGNDLGGSIKGTKEHDAHGAVKKTTNTYVEYLLGSVGKENENGDAGIFGGNFGNYDYKDEFGLYSRPYIESSFVKFKPKGTAVNPDAVNNYVATVFGGSLGTADDYNCSTMQHTSYILVEAPQDDENYANTDFYGGGAFAGMGLVTVSGETVKKTPGEGYTEIDLWSGQVHNVYGGCNKEGLLGYARVNVPATSTIKANALFGGGKGYDVNSANFDPTRYCDTYITLVDYNSENACIKDALYGGNENCRIACDTYINITKPVLSENGYIASVYGAGYGKKTVTGRTHVYLNDGAKVWYAFGGGRDGNTFNYATLTRWLIKQYGQKYSSSADILAGIYQYKGFLDTFEAYLDAHPITLPDPISTPVVNDIRTDPKKPGYDNTNVYIKKGAVVGNYAFGGGYGADANVCGSTNIQLLGGTVNKDLYGGGYGGPMEDEFQVAGSEFQTLLTNNPGIITTLNSYGIDYVDFYIPVKTNVNVPGGTCRNVYGGGYKGNIGYHDQTTTSTTNDIADAETHVTIGIRADQVDDKLIADLTYAKGSEARVDDLGFYYGVPAIQRNAYGAGEMSAIYGTSNITMNNGYIGYVYNGSTGKYVEKLDDETWEDGVGEGRLVDCGNIYGAGYDDLSSVDFTNVVMWGGTVRGSLHGGGEIATVGRGKIVENGAVRQLLEGNYYKAGGTTVTMYNGHVLRNVYGGGRGYNFLGYGGGNKLYTDGYVFGSTEVYIYGGEIGTAEGVIVKEDGTGGYGNVFGGGDVGYVYSKGYFNEGINTTNLSRTTGTGSPGHTYYYYDNKLTEDCKVVISPYLQVKTACTINGHSYSKYDYVPTDDLNTLPKKSSDGTFGDKWPNLYTGVNKNVSTATDDKEERGVIIHNAVFAGGNVSSNSDKTYANATTVFGNTTATIYDVYHRDFITVGTEHIGGLYGGGNLSMVDGYRELNITNYGTDYYGLNQRISLADYEKLSNRERAYFQLQYVCQTANNNHSPGDKISEDEYNRYDSTYKNETYWKQFGFCSIYAGRLLNTIQRADLCGVFGSRMVLQGAKDRVADVADATAYTINRVGELSLNKQKSSRSDDTGTDQAEHGNYFGIYSLVNHLGNLTSDVRLDDYRQVVTTNSSGDDVVQNSTQTYYNYKKDAYVPNGTPFNDRNKGYSGNQVALASGVFLELTTENSTADKKDYGYVTGIVELDLINVKQDIVGGGYVYAKNEHRVPKYYENKKNVILSEYNKKSGNRVCTYRCYLYDTTKDGHDEWSSSNAGTGTVVGGVATDFGVTKEYETSGNFIHRKKTIVDDCYPINNAYTIGGDPYSDAHYWYVKGSVYVYDQIVSAYTGSANAYSKEVNLPLTITAASNGKLKLLDVKPNKYAYYSNTAQTTTIGKDSVKVNNDSEVYYLNDVITYWDWSLLPTNEQAYFVDMTYVNSISCKIGTQEYAAGTYVMDETRYNSFNQSFTYTNDHGDAVTVNSGDTNYSKAKADVFRPSNDIAHSTGYVLTFDMNNPTDWDNWYSKEKSETYSKKNLKQYGSLDDTAKKDYIEGPTFRPTTAGTYGQKEHTVGEIITKDVYDLYSTSDQAKVDDAYVAKTSVTYTYDGTVKTVNKGTAIPKSEYDAVSSIKGLFDDAYVCVSSLKLDEMKYITKGDLLTADEIQELKDTYAKNGDTYTTLATDIVNVMKDAYICKESGLYGGRSYSADTNYSAISSWCSLSANDRTKFAFNYDALDLLVDPNYTGNTSLYKSPYDEEKSVEYEATLNTSLKSSVQYTKDGTTYTVDNAHPTVTSDIFENYITNEKRHFTKLTVPLGDSEFYIAINNFTYGGAPYAKGQVVNEAIYKANTSNVNKVTFTNEQSEVIKYYCYEACSTATVGQTILQAAYNALPNDQQYFTIQGMQPTETTTLYVSSDSDIRNVSKNRIITVVYQYTYNEDEGTDEIKTTSELHVVNIHLELESGVPEIGPLAPPSTVLPGTSVGLKPPTVSEGLYEVLTSGWELFGSSDDAENHRNGVDFVNNGTPVYWYQNGDYYVAFYAKTYLGKTYSNPVALSVANYHDLAEVMADTEHHYYIDHANVDRDPKVYINDYSADGKNGLDLLKDLFTLSTGGTLSGHGSLNTSKVGACKNLDFFLRTDINHSGEWNSIGNSTHCFEGTFHGDGHTISGLNNSLFGHLCADVYNLGVTGSFTGGGIAETGDGYMENCWIKTTGTPTTGDGHYAVFANPSRAENDSKGPIQVVNCYYPTSNAYTVPASDIHGKPTQKSDQAFNNGEVAYDLNGFYLKDRYDRNKAANDAAMGDTYVAYRYQDGDFRYANGTIPSGTDVRYWSNTVGETTTSGYAPIWPDDYLYFGQMLSYGYVDDHTYQPQPSHLVKNSDNSDRLYTTADNNRVYRAPAYFGNSTMGVAHFNPNCVLATKSSDGAYIVYPNMTAIDFTGGNDDVSGGYKYGVNGTTFYPPLLDDGGLIGFNNVDETQNLLVYTGKDTQTDGVVTTRLVEPTYSETNTNYRTVAVQSTEGIKGHHVQLVSSNYVAPIDHLLVDKENFNCPIAYWMGTGKRMWYQREPDNYVTTTDENKTTGWEGLSLPFAAELVTTQSKGELTHFYTGSTSGHEYWLREYDGGAPTADKTEFVARFNAIANGGKTKYYKNTYLWDTYYSQDSYWDLNVDEYQKTYYQAKSDGIVNTFSLYPYNAAGRPYLVGFPGKTYYEFDLSGEWTPRNRYENETILSPGKQTITFASAAEGQIAVSDGELTSGQITKDGYKYVPNYMNTVLTTAKDYVLASDGGSYVKNAENEVVSAFRPYIVYVGPSTTRGDEADSKAERVIFENNGTGELMVHGDSKGLNDGTLDIYGKRHKVVVESNLRYVTDVRIVNVAGITQTSFSIEPGETIETRIETSGVYIVYADNGKYVKKVIVK